MDKLAATAGEDNFLVLSDLPPSQAERRGAVVFALGIVVGFLIIVTLCITISARYRAFALAFSTAMFVCDVITAFLLFAQFSILRSPAIL